MKRRGYKSKVTGWSSQDLPHADLWVGGDGNCKQRQEAEYEKEGEEEADDVEEEEVEADEFEDY